MRLRQMLNTPRLVVEANIAAKVAKDPKQAKMLGIAFRHDGTIPRQVVASLGPKPTDEQIATAWGKLIDDTLRTNNYGDLSADGKFDDWLTRLYINGSADYEDINGEGGDALGAWKALSKRGLLKPQDQDFNKFTSIKQLQRIRNNRDYRDELRRIADAERIEKMKREKKDIEIVNDERFVITIPFNYGACYTFNNEAGFTASFCTGSSSGAQWFNRYADEGPIISVVDKQNMGTVMGKWQIHAPTNQVNNGDQSVRSDKKFSELFPGLMKKIAAGIEAHAEEIKEASNALVRGGYDIPRAIAQLKDKFPLSWASTEEPEAEPEAGDADATPGTWSVTHIPSNRTARIEAQNLEDLNRKLTARYPDYPLTDYRITKNAAEA